MPLTSIATPAPRPTAPVSDAERLVREVGDPWVEIHPADAAARGIGDGDRVRVHNDRGGFAVAARVTDKVRLGVLVAPSIWWLKKSSDGENANAVTSDALTDLGRGATYYDTAVEITRIEAVEHL